MQNSELFRQGIVLPLTDEAEGSLRANDVDASTQVQVVEIANDKLFARLLQLNVFEEINRRCGTLLDEYEEAWIAASASNRVLEVIELIASKTVEHEVTKFLSEFRILVSNASASSRPILVVL